MKYLAFGMLFGYLGGTVNHFLFYKFPYPPMTNIFVLVYVATAAYVIVKHRFLDIEIIVKKTLVYSSLIAIITIAYFIIVYILERSFSVIAGYHSIPIAIFIIAFFSLIFIPLKNHIQSYVDRRFFHGTIDKIDAEKKILESELRQSERIKTVSTLAAGMAHEIKNPLTSIKTFSEYVQARKDDPEFLEKFNRIVPREIDKILGIINQLLDYSKSEKMKMKPCDVKDILDYVLDLHSHELIRKNVKLTKKYCDENIALVCDENSMKQALINLVLNAIEAMPSGGELTVAVNKAGHTPGGNGIEVIIEDTGSGIPKEHLKEIFTPFFTTKDKGTGLGLFVVHQIIETNNGKIFIESVVGKGTAVRLVF